VGEGSTDTPQGVGHGKTEEFGHVPVLLKEAIDFLAVQRGGTYIDATVGLGGHSLEIAKRLGAPGRLIGFDKDPKALEIAKSVLSRTSHVAREAAGGWPEIELIH
jgi:16S rRNA (cytosine1402-N4)-methyltransferase